MPASATTSYAPTFSGTINQFDPSLGVLNSVTLAFSFTFHSSTQLGASAGGVGLTATSTVYWDGIVLGGGGNSTGGGGGPFATVPLTLTLSGDGPVQNLTLAEATGEGTASLLFAPTLTISPNTSIQLDSGSLQLTYDYTPSAIPEPATYAGMVGLCALGLAAFRRRARAARP